jgi:hypothetical protein
MLIQWNIQESGIGFTMRNCLMGTDTLDIDGPGSGERTIVCQEANPHACSSSSLEPSFTLIITMLVISFIKKNLM